MPAPIQLLFDLGLEDLNPIEVGESDNFPDRRVYPKSFNAIILHHVRKGCGTLSIKGKTYHVGPGQGFIIHPGEEDETHYISDHDDPWEYAWISFTGKLAHRFRLLPTVFSVPQNAFPHTYDLKNATDTIGYLLAADLHDIYARLVDPLYHRQDHIQLITEHIAQHYMERLTVEAFAERYRMDRRALSQQFKAKTGMSIRTYMTQIRLENAKQLLLQGRSSRETAILCGFGNASNFHKIFTAVHNMTPAQWKKDITSIK